MEMLNLEISQANLPAYDPFLLISCMLLPCIQMVKFPGNFSSPMVVLVKGQFRVTLNLHSKAEPRIKLIQCRPIARMLSAEDFFFSRITP